MDWAERSSSFSLRWTSLKAPSTAVTTVLGRSLVLVAFALPSIAIASYCTGIWLALFIVRSQSQNLARLSWFYASLRQSVAALTHALVRSLATLWHALPKLHDSCARF